MAEAIVKIQPFNVQQKVYISDNKYNNDVTQKTYSINLESLSDFLVDLNNVDTIHMMGNEKFVNLFVEQIKEKELLKYNDTKFNILINK